MSRLVLISNSYLYGRRYLEHCAGEIQNFLQGTQVVFVPYALKDWDAYTSRARSAFASMGFELGSVHEGGHTAGSIMRTPAFFVGGGNTFRLLKELQDRNMLDLIREAVRGGARYIGSSAGANVACPTIKTTNDMPIVCPRSFDALGLVPFQINPHYIDPDPTSKHMGETRDQRIAEFHEEKGNDAMVIGLREGAWITVENGVATLGGTTGAKLFNKGQPPREWGGEPIDLRA